METEKIKEAIKAIIDETFNKQVVNVSYTNPYLMQYQLTSVRDNLQRLCDDIEKGRQFSYPVSQQRPDVFDILVLKVKNGNFEKYIKENINDMEHIKKSILYPQNLLVISIDIRHSTFLMENIIDTEKYAEMMSAINKKIIEKTKEYFGIFDKFTGDGALLFFSEVISGDDYIKQGLFCAQDVIDNVREIIQEYKNVFYKFPYKVGAGIGIDIGEAVGIGIIMEKNICEEATYLGRCVVNACRIGNSSFNNILIGSHGYNLLINKYKDGFIKNENEKECEYKHSIPIKAYEITINTQTEPKPPEWANADKEQPHDHD
jgi:class 3 adenylate cyclase